MYSCAEWSEQTQQISCMPAAKDQDNFHYLLHRRLDAVLRLCEPQKTVTFALDGPAPVAKLITQR